MKDDFSRNPQDSLRKLIRQSQFVVHSIGRLGTALADWTCQDAKLPSSCPGFIPRVIFHYFWHSVHLDVFILRVSARGRSQGAGVGRGRGRGVGPETSYVNCGAKRFKGEQENM